MRCASRPGRFRSTTGCWRAGRTARRRGADSTAPRSRRRVPAATLLAIYPDADGRLVIPLTVRHADLRAHAGEVSLPGGTVDASDASREAAALREAWEEIGLEPDVVRIVGVLDDVWIPVSNFELRPFVGTVARATDARAARRRGGGHRRAAARGPVRPRRPRQRGVQRRAASP